LFLWLTNINEKATSMIRFSALLISSSVATAALLTPGPASANRRCQNTTDCPLSYECSGPRSNRPNICVIDTSADRDRDGIPNAVDNCPKIINPGQSDYDRDSKGDKCDADLDGDNVLNRFDNCPYYWNPQQDRKDLKAYECRRPGTRQRRRGAFGR